MVTSEIDARVASAMRDWYKAELERLQAERRTQAEQEAKAKRQRGGFYVFGLVTGVVLSAVIVGCVAGLTR
jgi:hypothetical protein